MENIETATPIVEVTAPSTLPEGFTFEAEANGRRFQVIVPNGGVEKGQVFSVSLPTEKESASAVDIATDGKFRDDLFDCFRQGLCHPSLCMPLWCCTVFCAVGQVMTRLNLNSFGDPISSSQVQNTFKTMSILGVLYVVCGVLQSAGDPSLASLAHLGRLGLLIWLVVVGSKTRHYLRLKYAISTSMCGAMEDCCCMFWCTCCTVSQMLRHTANYDSEPADCFSENGLVDTRIYSTQPSQSNIV